MIEIATDDGKAAIAIGDLFQMAIAILNLEEIEIEIAITIFAIGVKP